MERSCLLEEVSSLNSDCHYRPALIYYRTHSCMNARTHIQNGEPISDDIDDDFGCESKLGTWIYISCVNVKQPRNQPINQSPKYFFFYQRNLFLTEHQSNWHYQFFIHFDCPLSRENIPFLFSSNICDVTVQVGGDCLLFFAQNLMNFIFFNESTLFFQKKLKWVRSFCKKSGKQFFSKLIIA